MLDVFLLLSKLFGRDTEKKQLHLIQRANGQVDPRLISQLKEENIIKATLHQFRPVLSGREVRRMLHILF